MPEQPIDLNVWAKPPCRVCEQPIEEREHCCPYLCQHRTCCPVESRIEHTYH